MHFDTATRQRWMRVLAHSQPAALAARMNALSLAPGYDLLRAPEIGLVQIQARMGGTGARFFAGDATLTRAAIRLHSGKLGGLGVDVLAKEPPAADNPLLHTPNTLITPHMAWATARSRQNIINLTAENILRWQQGTPVNVVNGVKD